MNKEDSEENTPHVPRRRPGRPAIPRDAGLKVEFSRQSARNCRARKKIRYQYLKDLVDSKEKAVFHLRQQLKTVSFVLRVSVNTGFLLNNQFYMIGKYSRVTDSLLTTKYSCLERGFTGGIF